MQRPDHGMFCAVHLRAAAVAALSALCLPVLAQQATPADLKTAYAYNFIVLSTWPAESPAVLRFCVAGSPADAAAFNVLGGKVARERTLSVVNVASPEGSGDCSILYLPPAESKRVGPWLAAVAKRATLTISDQADAPGAIVNLRPVGRQIVFDLDTRAAAAAGIQLSSQLIKLAATRK